MLRIKGNTIVITRGDSLRLKVIVKDHKGNEYNPTGNDKILFALKNKYTDKQPLIQKQIPLDTMQLHLTSEDTKKLEMPAKYVYDISITYGETGDVDTFIDRARFITTEEVG